MRTISKRAYTKSFYINNNEWNKERKNQVHSCRLVSFLRRKKKSVSSNNNWNERKKRKDIPKFQVTTNGAKEERNVKALNILFIAVPNTVDTDRLRYVSGMEWKRREMYMYYFSFFALRLYNVQQQMVRKRSETEWNGRGEKRKGINCFIAVRINRFFLVSQATSGTREERSVNVSDILFTAISNAVYSRQTNWTIKKRNVKKF